MKLRITNEQGSMLLDAVVGSAIAILVLIMPLQMYYNSRLSMKGSNEGEKAMQVTQMMVDEFRSMLAAATPLCPGAMTKYYNRDGLYLGNQSHFASWSAAEKAPIYYVVGISIESKCQDNLSLGVSGFTADIDLKNLKIQTNWFPEWNGNYNTTNLTEKKKFEVSTILNGSRKICSALPECHCISNPSEGVNCL